MIGGFPGRAKDFVWHTSKDRTPWPLPRTPPILLTGRPQRTNRSVPQGEGWQATCYTTGMELSPTSATGTGWERPPWHATEAATVAWNVREGRRPDP